MTCEMLSISSPRAAISGGDHDREVSTFETAQGLLTLSLCAIAMQARDLMSRKCDLACHLVRAMFGAGKGWRAKMVSVFLSNSNNKPDFKWAGTGYDACSTVTAGLLMPIAIFCGSVSEVAASCSISARREGRRE